MESKCHIRIKEAACGGKNGTESKLPSGRHLDCCEPKSKTCSEVEFHKRNLGAAVTRLDEGFKTGRCAKANLITKDKFVPLAQKLVGKKNIEVIGLSATSPLIRFT